MSTSPAIHAHTAPCGAVLTGHLMTEAEKAAHDRLLSFSARRVIRIAQPISLAGPRGQIIAFPPRDLPDMSNVIAAHFGSHDTPPTGAPAAALRRAA